MSEKHFYRRRLPHWHLPNATFFVTFRLEGSLPAHVIANLQDEYDQAKRQVQNLPSSQRSYELYENYRKAYARFERALEKSDGPRWLAEPHIADIIQSELNALHPDYYHLHAYCLMPNHLHLLVDLQDIAPPSPRKNGIQFTALTQALWLLKGRTGHAYQKALRQNGRFWAREFYDHVVRDDKEYERILKYIVNNPVKAGLVEEWQQWPFTYVAKNLIGD